jgi:hypothetical protein
LKTLGWTPAFAGETNLRHRPFSSFRRKPESSGIEEEFDVYTITALLEVIYPYPIYFFELLLGMKRALVVTKTLFLL